MISLRRWAPAPDPVFCCNCCCRPSRIPQSWVEGLWASIHSQRNQPGCENPLALCSAPLCLRPSPPVALPCLTPSTPICPSNSPDLPFLGTQQGPVGFLECLVVPPLPGRWVERTPLPFCYLTHPIRWALSSRGKLAVSLTANTQTD